MTRIDGIGWPALPRVAPRAAASSGFFVAPEPAGAGHATAAAGVQATPPGCMLALQELDGETVADRQARRHGRDMLAALTELQRALLRSGGDEAALQRLMELAASVPCATDPHLAALVSAITLRVRVELARRQNTCMSAC